MWAVYDGVDSASIPFELDYLYQKRCWQTTGVAGMCSGPWSLNAGHDAQRHTGSFAVNEQIQENPESVLSLISWQEYIIDPW